MYRWLLCFLLLLPARATHAQTDTIRDRATLEMAIMHAMMKIELPGDYAVFAGMVVTVKDNIISDSLYFGKCPPPFLQQQSAILLAIARRTDWAAVLRTVAKSGTYKVLIPLTWEYKGDDCYDTFSPVVMKRMISELERQLAGEHNICYVLEQEGILRSSFAIRCDMGWND